MSEPGPRPATPAAVGRRPTGAVLVAAVLVVLVALAAGAAAGFALGDRDTDRSMMRDQSTGRDVTERDFLADMTAHHEEAVAMAEQLQRSERPEMRALGQRIVRSQTAQAEQMRSWSRQWYGTSSLRSDYEPMARDLTRLEGDALDEAFLLDMVPHHMVAVMMSRHLLGDGSPEHQQVADLATAVIEEQTAEIVQMRRWLQAWYDEGMMPGGPMMQPVP